MVAHGHFCLNPYVSVVNLFFLIKYDYVVSMALDMYIIEVQKPAIYQALVDRSAYKQNSSKCHEWILMKFSRNINKEQRIEFW